MAIDKIIIQYEAQVAEFKKELDGLKKELRSVDSTATKGAKKTEQAFDKAGGGVNKLGTNLKNLAGTMGLVLGAQEVIAFTKRTIDAASDLNETISKTQQIFGTASASVEAFAANSAKEFGMSKRAALDAASSFGGIGKAAGLTGQDLSTFSTDLVGLSADLASFGNTTPEEAVLALTAALRGEGEAIGRYNVYLDDASLRQEAFNLNLVSTTKNALTPQTKALAANSLIMKQTADAQGDFGKTSEGAANQQRILAANFENVMAMLGEKLLPAFEKGAQTLNEFMTAVDWDLVFGGIGDAYNEFIGPWKEIFSALGEVFDLLTANSTTGETTASVMDAIGVAAKITSTPIRLIAKYIKALTENVLIPLITTGQKVITWFGEVRESGGFVGAIFNGIASAAQGVIDRLRGVAEFIGFVDSEEQVAAKNKIKAEDAKKKAVEDAAKAEQAAKKEKLAADVKAAEEEKKRTDEQTKAATEAAKKRQEINKAFAAAALKLSEEVTLALIEDENERAAKQLELQKAADLRELEASEFTAKQKGQLKAQIDAKYDQLEKDRQEKLIEDKKKKEQEFSDFLEDLNNQSREDEQARAKETIAFYNNATTRNSDRLQKQLDDELAMYADLINQGFPESEEEKLRIAEYFAKKRKEIEETQGDEATQGQIDNIQKVETKMGEVFGAVNSVLGPAMDALNGYFDLQLNNLEKEKNQRLANENLTAEERLRIEEEYEAKKNAILAEQFEVSRGSQIIQAIMSSAQAALNAFTSTALLFAPAAPAAAAAAAAFGALQIGIIAAQPNPYKFFEGTDYLQLGGNPRGKDTIPVMAHEGEAIIPTGKNLQYPGLAKSWIDGNLDSYIHKKFISPALMEQQREMEADFADKIAASMAFQMTGGFDDYRLHRDMKEQTAVLRHGFENLKQTRKKLRGA